MKILPMATVTDIYADYATALASCGPGYHDADIADVIAFKTVQRIEPYAVAPEQALNSIIAVGIAAADIRDRQLNVLDFGGGCGFHYFRVATATRTPLRWAIVETETVAARATKLAQNYFRVFTTIGDVAAALGIVDLVHASSAIQYVPDPPAVLEAFVALRPRHILLARLPLWREPAIVGVQVSPLSHNGIGSMPPDMQDREIKYPVTFMNIEEILRILDGYDVVLTMDAPSSSYVVGDKSVPVSALFYAPNGPDTDTRRLVRRLDRICIWTAVSPGNTPAAFYDLPAGNERPSVASGGFRFSAIKRPSALRLTPA